ncbi:hypothetical protein NI35_1874 [Salmonella enterica subsp. enterica serovar Cerro]|uniref:Uncharacterized protein n=1 Tax=Salmonella enterica subsp. enterica serovar Uganda str. R8-3404 TaxID=913083 RepID=A0A6C8H184_SALET|nr:hypothetical protein STBHUCCB_3780 [Salmonella enterica subsp. enterica serovar Typhi str. P-stx-12]APT78479.1 hypothetical protein GW13_PRO1603 [Salmonella enterica subsp. enterica serovar Cerro]AXR56135.1 hypothetical protein CJP42_1402 [Salmonella enterica subsp. enterica serovar Typhi]EHC89366.1 hypothetical protein LTSEUGA_3681 [Salmonella enterica subsp. enterica serovar Uganda str. R8-3404]KMN29298.1 hypothetical protein NI35_1874 [Salmonella enterica subsp. enterica serovar Cerro]
MLLKGNLKIEQDLQYRLERRAKYVCRSFRTGAKPQQS